MGLPTISEPSGSPSVMPTKMPTSSDPSFAPSGMPSGAPSRIPTSSTPTKMPTDLPSSAPSHWYDPRWEEFSNGATQCARTFKVSRTCQRGCSYTQCQNSCKDNSRCKFFFFRAQSGFCMLYNGCSTMVNSSSGVIVRKIVVPTNEPTYNPTSSNPTALPTISEPSGSPSVMPTKMPTSSQPSYAPSGMPSGTPTSSMPT